MIKKIALAAAAVTGILGAGAAGAAAYAATTSSIPPNTLHGCITGTRRALEHVYASNTAGVICPSGEQRVIWPKGADSDPAAAPVTAGPGGLDVTVVTNQVNGDGQQFVYAVCPSDHPHAIGGGGTVANAPLQESYPLTTTAGPDTAWYIHAGPSFNGGLTGTIEAYAVCAK